MWWEKSERLWDDKEATAMSLVSKRNTAVQFAARNLWIFDSFFRNNSAAKMKGTTEWL